MKKNSQKFIALMMALIILLGSYNTVFAASGEPIKTVQEQGYSYKLARRIDVFIDSKKQELTLPILADTKNNRTLYPFRELLESIGAEVKWDDNSQTAVATYKDTVIEFPLNQNYYYVNGAPKLMDTKAIIDPTVWRSYIPIRYALEALGYTVQWIPSQKHDEIRIYNLGEYSEMSDEDFADKVYNYDHSTLEYYDMDYENRRIIFKDEYSRFTPHKDYVQPEKINPDINRQVYDLVKVLADEDRFLNVRHNPKMDDEDRARTFVYYHQGRNQYNNNFKFFGYIFFTDEYSDLKGSYPNTKTSFSEKVFMRLDLQQLHWGYEYSESLTDPFFEKKLRDSLIAAFGKTTGTEIYAYVYEKHVSDYKAEDSRYYAQIGYKDTQVFGNIQLDYICSGNHEFYFSYVE